MGDQYERHRVLLWSGALPEVEFWNLLLDYASLPRDADRWRTRTLELMEPLDVVNRLQEWSAACEISALSNHRHEWVLPKLDQLVIMQYFSRLLVSSQTGLVKPDPSAFAVLLPVPADRSVLFVDDKPLNVHTAEDTGAAGLIADPGSRWLVDVERWLGING